VPRKLPYHLLLILAAGLWLLAALGHRESERRLSPARIAQLVESDLDRRIREFRGIESHQDEVQSWLKSQTVPKGKDWLLKQKDFILFGYQDDSLIAWTQNTAFPTAVPGLRPRMYQLSNGTYAGYQYPARWLPAGVKLAVLFPVRIRYSLSNQYLRNRFPADPAIDGETTISDTPSAKSAPLYLPGRQHQRLGYVQHIDGPMISQAPPVWVVVCWILSLALAFFWLQVFCSDLALRGSPGYAAAIIILSVLVGRLVLLRWGYPFNLNETALFSPSLYAGGEFLGSLGDLLFNTLGMLWITAFVAIRVPIRKYFNQENTSRYMRWVVAISANALVAGYAILFVWLIRSLIRDSVLPFDNPHLSALDGRSLTGLLIASLLTLSVLLVAGIGRRIAESLLPRFGCQMRACAAGIAIMLVALYRELDMPYDLLCCLWLFVYIAGQHYPRFREGRSIFRPSNLFWTIAHCILLTLLLQSYVRQRELAMRRNFAEHIATREDDALEYNYSQVENYLLADSMVRQFFRDPSPARRQDLDERLATLYLNNSFPAYQAEIYFYNNYNAPLYNEDTTGLSQFSSIANNSSPTRVTPSLYFRELTAGDHTYLGIIPIPGDHPGIIVLDLAQKKIVAETVLPELLQPAAVNQAERNAGYSYAVYNDGKLVAQTSDYPFPFYMPKGGNGKQFQERRNNDASTLIYTPDSRRRIVVWHRLGTTAAAITIFSYLLLLRFLLVGISNLYVVSNEWLSRPVRNRLIIAIGLRRRVQLAVMLIVACSFLLIGLVTVTFLKRQYANTNKAERQAMMQRVTRTIHEYLRDHGHNEASSSLRTLMSEPKSRYFLGDLASSQKIDINLFDAQGKLCMATQRAIYDQGLQAPLMRPDILDMLKGPDARPLIMVEESIGTLRYISCYTTLKDEQARNAGYLNVPLFYSKRELDEQIGSVIVALINLYAVVFLFSSLLAYVITRWITRAFDVIISQFGNLALHGNEPLQWPYDDEIGLLVVEYNKMVSKVEESAALLARSEREGAFREMARQVAHEIKNPLTPMSLNVQYLQKAIKGGHPNALDLAQRMTESLLEQINNLSIIASEFSDFARVGSRPEEILLNEVVRNVCELYLNEPGADVTYIGPQQQLWVLADRSQLVRMITNLMQNAVQSIPHTRHGSIRARLQPFGETAQITVRDNGSGISEEAQAKLFTPYFTTKNSGTGLGLAMTRQMVESWGGNISYETEADVGTTFIIRLPLRIPAHEREEEAHEEDDRKDDENPDDAAEA
jgi:two-component system nitrogen regulation sensor histidine kinase NtrY